MTTTRTCPSCGAAVAAGERFCANCGSRMPDQATPAGGQPAVEPTLIIPPAPSAGPTTPLPPAQGPATPLPPPQTPMQLPSDAGAPLPPMQRKGLPVWAIVLLGVAGLCAIGCIASFGLLAYFGREVEAVFPTIEAGLSTSEANSTTPEEATPEEGGLVVPTLEDLPTRPPESTVEAAPTVEAEPTAEAAPTSSGAGGVVGGVVGGAGSATQAQTEVAATAQALEASEELGQLFSGANEVFKDEFVDNRNAWFTGVFQEIETDKIEDGVFKVIWAAKGSSYELYEVRELTNFIAEVDCRVVSGGADGSCGLIFGQRDEVGFYKFELFEDYYRLFTVQAEGDPPILAEGNPEGVVRAGDWNRLRAIKQGDRIRVYLNETLLADVSDPAYPTGKVGVSTNSYLEGPGVEINFDNFIIWELPS